MIIWLTIDIVKNKGQLKSKDKKQFFVHPENINSTKYDSGKCSIMFNHFGERICIETPLVENLELVAFKRKRKNLKHHKHASVFEGRKLLKLLRRKSSSEILKELKSPNIYSSAR